MYRTGLSSACKHAGTRDILRRAVRQCHAIRFATTEIFASYAARVAATGEAWGPKEDVGYLQSFLWVSSASARASAAEKLTPLLRQSAERFVESNPAVVAACRLKTPGLSKTLEYQETSVWTAFTNMLEYSAVDSLHRNYAMAIHKCDKAEAQAVARCLGSDKAARRARADQLRARSRKWGWDGDEDDDDDAVLLRGARGRLDEARLTKVAEAVAAMAGGLPDTNFVADRFRHRATLARELDAKIDEMGDGARELGVRRVALFPRTGYRPGFIRVDKEFFGKRLPESLDADGGSFVTRLFDARKLKRMLTGTYSVLGPTFLTDGIQLQITTITKAKADANAKKQAASVKNQAENKRRREETGAPAERPLKVGDRVSAPKRARTEAALKRPKAPEEPDAEPVPQPPPAWKGARSWTGVDPGHANVYTAHRSFASGAPPETFGLSLGAYYAGIGHADRKRALERAKLRRPDVAETESELSELDGSRTDVISVEERTRARCAAFGALAAFYSQPRLVRAAFVVAMKRDKLVAEHARRLVPDPTKDHVFWGDASFCVTRKGTMPAACSLLRKEVERRAGAAFSEADEFRTSCLCSACGSFMKKALGQAPKRRGRCNVARPVGAAKRKLHGVMQCPKPRCGRTWNRDANAAANILYVGVTLPCERREQFDRTYTRPDR